MSDDKLHFDTPSVRSERAVLSTMLERSSAAPESLPLFQWQPPRQVLLFPLDKRVGKVRHVAQKLSGKQGDDAALYWKQVIAANRKHLERVGAIDAEIEAELRNLFDAVQSELNRMSYDRRGGNPGGAA